MVFFNVKVNFDNFSSVNIVNSVIYKFYSLQELILLTKKDFVLFLWVDLLWLTRVCERLHQQQEVKEMGGS